MKQRQKIMLKSINTIPITVTCTSLLTMLALDLVFNNQQLAAYDIDRDNIEGALRTWSSTKEQTLV